MTIDTAARRVRHEVADGVRVLLFSLATSVGIAALTALVLGAL